MEDFFLDILPPHLLLGLPTPYQGPHLCPFRGRTKAQGHDEGMLGSDWEVTEPKFAGLHNSRGVTLFLPGTKPEGPFQLGGDLHS